MNYKINKNLLAIFDSKSSEKEENKEKQLVDILMHLEDLENYILKREDFNAGEFFIFNSDKNTCQSIFNFLEEVIGTLFNYHFYRKNACFCKDEASQRDVLNKAFDELNNKDNPQLFVQQMVKSGNEMKIVIIDYDQATGGDKVIENKGICHISVRSSEEINDLLNTEFNQDYLHIIQRGFVLKNEEQPKFRIIYIPALISTSIPTNFFGVFTNFNEFENNLDFIFELQNYLTIIFASVVNYVILKKNHIIKRESIKSAIAAIMARNMSHNLGSHVFYYTRNQINQIAPHSGDYQSDLKGLSWFLHYIQERQDFVATVTSQDDFYYGPLNLKMDVMDELTPDAVDERHNSEPSSTNFILKYIVQSEHLTRDNVTFDLKEKYPDKIDIIIERKINDEYVQFNSLLPESKKEIVKHFYDIDIAVKGGQQSRHAFLIILENILRNAAKHGFKREGNDGLKLTIRINDDGQDGYDIEIYDNLGNGVQAKENLNEFLQNLTVLNNDNNATINRDSKGLKEILVCIAWLKKINYEDLFAQNNIYQKIKEDKILEITTTIVGTNLCYKFNLPKFIPEYEITEHDIDNIKDFKKYGSVAICDTNLIEEAKYIFPRLSEKKETELNKIDEQLTKLDVNSQSQEKALDYWKNIVEVKSGITETEKLPIIIFERDKTTERGINGEHRIFIVESDNKIKDKINNNRGLVLFKNHLNTELEKKLCYLLQKGPNKLLGSEFNWDKGLFVESISGATYAFNLLQMVENAFDQLHINKNALDLLYYKILDSFYTKIVIVDERLCPVEEKKIDFNDLTSKILDNIDDDAFLINNIIDKYFYSRQGDYLKELKESCASDNFYFKNWYSQINTIDKKPLETTESDFFKIKHKFYKLQNTYLFNMNNKGELISPKDPIDQSKEGIDSIHPHFFSIHIGLLDKLSIECDYFKSYCKDLLNLDDDYKEIITKNDQHVEIKNYKLSTKAKMLYLKKKFSLPENTFMAVHSGRGGLTDNKKDVTFIPFANLQWSLENTKFKLSELFQNQIYFKI